MLSKSQRHDRIARLVQSKAIYSQQELQDLLARDGAAVTQATLSRDLASMGVLKGPAGYVLPDAASAVAAMPGHDAQALLQRTLRREARSIEVGGSLIVLRTDPGHANVVAVDLDRARLEDVLGTIAGDDTIFLATRSDDAAARIAAKLRLLAQKD